jgi:hypothetical protein
MNTKLTLNIDKNVIEKAKSYAKNNNVSLSKLIENYLGSLNSNVHQTNEVSPLIKSLTGVIPSDFENDRYEYKV